MPNDDDQNQQTGHAKAGEEGENKVNDERGSEYYSEIGRQGGKSQGQENNPGNFANDPDKASEDGRKGGSQ
jgi:general stress protein YciG